MLGVLCASIGSIMVNEAIKLITGIGEPLLGRLMVYDALEMTYRTVRIRKDPSTPKITELIDYDAFCGVVSDEAQDAAAGHTITALELKDMIDAGKDFALIDVREQNEYEIVSIPGATLIPKGRILSGEALAEIPQDKPVVLHCKSGARSAEALAVLHKAGFSRRRACRRWRARLGEAGRPLTADLLIVERGWGGRCLRTPLRTRPGGGPAGRGRRRVCRPGNVVTSPAGVSHGRPNTTRSPT